MTTNAADVAVVMRTPIESRWQLKSAIIDETYPILLDLGLHIQPWPVNVRDLKSPDEASNPMLLRNILRDGIPA